MNSTWLPSRISASFVVMTIFVQTTTDASLPNDPDFFLQWGLRNSGQPIDGVNGAPGADVDAEGAWTIHAGARPVVVAIVGTGVNPHEEFADRLLDGYISSLAGGDPYSTLDTGSNGTRAAGIIAARRDNGVGMAGLNDKALLLPVRVAQGGMVTAESVAEGIVWAADQRADVILVLVQLFQFNQALADAVDYGYGRDCLVIAAAGHTGEAVVAYPAAFDNCLAVSATTNRDARAEFSNRGPEVDVAAPGADIWSTSASGGYGYETSANSFSAAAFVAGVASLIRSYAPQLNVAQVREAILSSADDLGEPGRDDQFGAGRIDARGALDAAAPPLLRFEPLDAIPRRIPPMRTTRFGVHIADVAEALNPTSPKLIYRTAPGTFDGTAQLDALGGGVFSALLPRVRCGTTVEYFLLAAGQSGMVQLDPPAAPLRLYSASVDPAVPVFVDDFEEDRGWETLVVGAATKGAWTRVVPVGTFSGVAPVQPGYDRTPNAGRNCFVTGQHFGGDPGTNDVDGGPVVLISPVVAVGGAQEVEVSFFAWFYTASGTPDALTVELSRDGGSTWAVAENVTQNTVGWERRAVKLSAFPSLVGSQLRVRFSTSDNPSDSLTEAAVDDFRVNVIACNPNPFDADWDGDVDWGDMGALSNCMSGPNTAGKADCMLFDVDGDRDVDLVDGQAFANGFAPGGR